MNTKLRTRSMGLAALALTASMGLAACGSEDDTTSASEPTTSESTHASPTRRGAHGVGVRGADG